MRNSDELVKKGDVRKAIDLFHKMQDVYPKIFGDLTIQRSCRCCIDVKLKRIYMSLSELNEILNPPYDYIYMPWYKEYQKFNKDLCFAEFVLLHELGHWLDYIDNPEEFEYNAEQKVEISRFLTNHCIHEDLINYLYTVSKLERRATLNAYKMAKVLADEK